jgi:3-oxoacyl-[acyl-carrier protein] reductase
MGAAVARALAAEGARVAIAARPGERLSAMCLELDALAVPVDLVSETGPAAAVSAAAEALGGLDALLVNMAGPPSGRFAEVSDETWQRALDATFWSSIRLLRAALPLLTASERGAVCVILSSSVREPIPALTTSNLLRPGLVGLIKSLVPEIAPVRINGIAPGKVATEHIAELDAGRAKAAGVTVADIQQQTIARIPLGRYGDPAEVGRVAAFLLSPAASYVTGAIVAGHCRSWRPLQQSMAAAVFAWPRDTPSVARRPDPPSFTLQARLRPAGDPAPRSP